MTDVLRRKWYREDRVLIETARILDPQFRSTILSVTGAQLELLRNLMAYLNRESTFASQYFARYYLTPTVNEWDSLSAIIADLEEKIMGNENEIWGYSGRWFEMLSDTASGTGHASCTTTPVPDDTVYVLQQVTVWHDAGENKEVRWSLFNGSPAMHVFHDLAAVTGKWYCWSGEAVLAPGDTVNGYVTSPGDGKEFRLRVWGYQMAALLS